MKRNFLILLFSTTVLANNPGLNRIVGLRIFYCPLFSKNRSTGTVLGAAMEAHLDLVNKG